MINVKIQIYKYNPIADSVPYYSKYKLKCNPRFRIIDILNEIIKLYKIDISFELSCQSGVCGLCAIMLNRKPVLMCKEPVLENMLIEPLDNFKVVKDLIIDRRPYQDRLKRYKLFLVKDLIKKIEKDIPKQITMKNIKASSRCTRCFSCLSVCPVFSKDPDSFAGPTAFVLAAYYIFHPNDQLDRKEIIIGMGIESCIECGKCSEVCNFDVNPLYLIREIKKLYNIKGV